MIKIRQNIFETNSSSTHSLIIAMEEEYNAWEKGDLLFDEENNKFIKSEDATEVLEKQRYDYLIDYLEENSQRIENGWIYNNIFYNSLEEMVKVVEVDDSELFEWLYDNGDEFSIKTFDEYWAVKEDEFETYIEKYTTKKGDKIIVFGYYG